MNKIPLAQMTRADVAARLRIALAIGIAAMLAAMLGLLRPNAAYVTFNILEGIVLPVLGGGTLIVGAVLVLLLAETPLRLSRFWLVRLLSAAVLVNLGVDIFYSAIGMDLGQLLARVGPGVSKYRDQVRDISNLALLLVLGIASRRPPFLGKVYRLFVALVAVAAVLTAYRAVPPIWADFASASGRSAEAAPAPTRTVVWVIFDELDQRELERAAEADRVPAFKRLESSGITAVRARSPATRTHLAIPELLAGTAFEAVSSLRPTMLAVTPTGRPPVNFDEVDTVVDAVQARHGAVQVAGFFHPYCRLFPQVENCRAYSIQNMHGLTFLLNALHTISLSQSKRLLPLFGIDWRRDELVWGDQMAYITRRQVEDLRERFRPGEAALHFLHFNVPHFPRNRYGEELFNTRDRQAVGDDAYQFNLKLADHILGMILERIEQSAASRVLLVVSGDHGRRPLDWRIKGIDDRADALRRVPFLVWIKGEQAAARIDERIETLGTRALVEGYLGGEIDNQSDVRRFLQSRLARDAKRGTRPATAR